MNTRDPALDYFLADARRLGLSLRQYESQFKIQLAPSERAIFEKEMALGDQPIEAQGFSADPASFVGEDDVAVRHEGGVSVVDRPTLSRAALILDNGKPRTPADMRKLLGIDDARGASAASEDVA